MLLVALQLHKEAYTHLNLQRPTTHPPCRQQVSQSTTPTQVSTQAVTDTGAQMDIISLPPLKSLGFNPNTLIKVQIKATSAVKGFMLDIEGGIFLSVRSPNHSNHLKAVRLFYVTGNVSQDYLSCPCLRALFVIGQDFPRIGAATSNTPRPYDPSAGTLRSGTVLRDTRPREDAQRRCNLRPSPIQTQDTKDAVMLQRITSQLPRQNHWTPNRGEPPPA